MCRNFKNEIGDPKKNMFIILRATTNIACACNTFYFADYRKIYKYCRGQVYLLRTLQSRAMIIKTFRRRLFIFCSSGEIIKMRLNGDIENTFQCHERAIISAEFNDDFVTTCDSKTIRITNIHTSDSILTLDYNIFLTHVKLYDRYLYIAAKHNIIRYDLVTGQSSKFAESPIAAHNMIIENETIICSNLSGKSAIISPIGTKLIAEKITAENVLYYKLIGGEVHMSSRLLKYAKSAGRFPTNISIGKDIAAEYHRGKVYFSELNV